MLKLTKFSKSVAAVVAIGLAFAGIAAGPAQALTATINAVSFKAPVFDSYNHATGGGTWNDGSVTYDKGELLGTNYKCGDIATFLLELNVSSTPTKQPAPYKAEIKLTYTWDATGQSGTSLTPLTSSDHLRVNTGVIRNAAGTTIGGATGTVPAGVPAGYDSGFNAAGLGATVATSPAPVVANSGSEFTSGATDAVTFTVQGIQAGANIIVRSDVVIHCKPNSSPTGNMQAALSYVNVTYPGAPEAVSAGNQTVNFRGVGNLAGLGSSLSVSKSISTNGNDCTSTVSARSFASTGSVLYCYVVTNTGNNDISGVQVKDDNATSGNTADDVVISMSIRSVAQSASFTLAVGDTAFGSYSHAYATAGTYTNIVTVTSATAPTASASAIATMGSTPALSLSKSQTSGSPSAVGDVISYTLTLVNNTGNNSGADVTDTNASSLTCGATTVNAASGSYGLTINNVSVGNSAGATFTCTATHIVSAADVTAGSVSNFFTAAKQSTTYTSNTVTTPIVSRPLTYSLDVTKIQSSTARPKAAGEVITYYVQVTNTGTGDLSNVSLTDLLPGATLGTCQSQVTGTPTVTLPLTTLSARASFICAVSYTINSTDVSNGWVTNQARAASTGTGALTVDSNTVSTRIQTLPSIQVNKIQATGPSGAAGQYPSAVGQVLTYGIAVYNDGNVDLTGVVVTDNNADSGSLICDTPGATTSGAALAVGATISCTASHTVTQADLTAGSITNVAHASGTGGSTVVSADSPNVTTVAALTIVKSRTSVTNNHLTGSTAGDTISYNIVVTNTGEVTLTNLVIADANASVSCTASQLLSLAPGASVTCTATHIATLAEATANIAYNTASVRTTQIPTPIISNQVSTPLVTPTVPHVSVVKARTSSAPVNEGDVVTYSITVSSDGVGNATVAGVTDANATLGTCTQNSNPVSFPLDMAAGTSFVCTASHTVTSVDMRAGSVSNTASVTADDTSTHSTNLNTNSNTVTDPLTATASLSVVKSYTGAAPSNAGDVVHYSIVVTNNGTMTLTNVSVSDPLIGTLTCSPTQPRATFVVGASFTCTGTYTVTSGDVTAGHVNNTATATATYNGSSFNQNSNQISLPLSAPAPVHVPVADLSITKQLTNTVNGKVGDVISYKLTITNSGETYLTGVSVTDGNATITSCSVTLATNLAQGESFSCVATHIVTDADMAAGKVDNTATATSTNAYLIRYSNLVTVPLTAAPAIQVSKALASAAPAKAGDTIGYTITVKNTGNVTLNSVTVTDANATLGACSVVTPATLAVGASFTCAATHVVTNADFAAGKVDNVAAASGTSVAGTSAGASSSSTLLANSNLVTVPLVAAPSLNVVKALNGAAPAKTGDVITYSIMVTNSGNVDLTGVTVTDANATVGTCAPVVPAALAIGASITCAATHVTTDADFAAGKVDNVAAASGNFGGGNGNVTGNSNLVTVPLTFAPQISVVKQQVGGLPTKLGGFIHYTIAVTNTGNVNLHNVTIVDDNATITDCDMANPAPVLNIGQTITCAAKHALTAKDVEAGKVVNVATATSAENATASSNATGGTGSSTGTAGTQDPGSVVVPSNGVVTFIKIAGIRGKFNGEPNGGTVTLSGTALSNPKLKVLAFTGDLDNVVEDSTLFLLLAAGIALIMTLRRRISRR